MSRLDEIISQQFRQWEQRGRGWKVWPQPVAPEPPFLPFYNYVLPPQEDDGRVPSLGGSLRSSLERWFQTKPPPLPDVEPPAEPEPDLLVREDLVELQAVLPGRFSPDNDLFHELFGQLALCSEPVAFELLGTTDSIITQFVTHPRDAPAVRRQCRAFFPEVILLEHQGLLEQAWQIDDPADSAVVEFGLGREILYPLAVRGIDPFLPLVAALSELQPSEAGLFQVLFQPACRPWSEHVQRAVIDSKGRSYFVNRSELPGMVQDKFAGPLFGAVVRIATQAADFDRTWQLARDLAIALRTFTRPDGNELIPLRNDDYPYEDHIDDMLRRQSRRTGMLLNRDELIRFVHFPTADVRSPKFVREVAKSKAAPPSVSEGVLLGHNTHAGNTIEVRLSAEQRVRHTHVIGASGTGKSTLLFNLIRQDIENGEGAAVLDPHGDLIERILGIIPPQRIEDVVLVDPSDEEHSVGFNILSAHSDFEKNLLASDLVSVFARLSTSWGDQMGSVLQNAILAFLESDRGGTLADLRRFLIDVPYRNEFLKTVRDSEVVFYWQKAFPQLTGNKSIGPVLTRLDTFLAPKPIRYMVSQQESRLDFANILDTGKIFLAKLPQGQMGKENAFLLGSLLVSKFQQLAMSRQRMSAAQRRNFWLYIDEFQNFITPSMAEILTGARKYRLGLILAHQELRQLERDREVASAVLSNPHTRVVFRVGDDDARKLGDGFASFDARDLQNLATGQAICRIETSDQDFNLTVPMPEEPYPDVAQELRLLATVASREKYSTPRNEIEAALSAKLTVFEPPKAVRKDTEPAEVPKASEPTPPVTGSETTAVPPVTNAPVAPIELSTPPVSAEPRDMGMGGAQHQLTQKRIKQEAEALGFLATIEKPIPRGSVDVLLERAGLTIACEIGITTPIDHECGNVAKCLEAGFQQVAVISRPERLRKIADAVAMALGGEVAARVRYYTPDEFIDFLKGLPAPVAPPNAPPTETIRRGRKVRVKARELTPEERQEKEKTHIARLAELMRRKPNT